MKLEQNFLFRRFQNCNESNEYEQIDKTKSNLEHANDKLRKEIRKCIKT